MHMEKIVVLDSTATKYNLSHWFVPPATSLMHHHYIKMKQENAESVNSEDDIAERFENLNVDEDENDDVVYSTY